MQQGHRRRRVALPVLVSAVGLVAACTNAPPPPLADPNETTPPPPSSDVPTTQPMPTEVVVGVDDFEGGFNPHTLADMSPSTSALANLMLPSVFVPGKDGAPALNTTLMESAEPVPGAEKFTVRYRIKREASWSDGAPIAAEDFVYLAEQMSTQAGVANPAGYQLIDDVSSSHGGKVVDVTFTQPFQGWRSLFDHLLPAHLMRDAPRGWNTVLDNGYPASGGPFAIRQVDLDRGEVSLERNDRYWGPPARADRLTLRAVDTPLQVEALRSGDSHLAVFDSDKRTLDTLRSLGDKVDVRTVPRPQTLQMLLRPDSPALADTPVRRAVLAGLDRQRLVTAGTGGGPAQGLTAHAQVRAPSEPSYRPTEPPAVRSKPDPQRVRQLLREAGYTESGGRWTRGGERLTLTIAAPFERQSYRDVAEEAARQLRELGIGATVVTPTGDELYGSMLSANPLQQESSGESAVDMAVAPRAAGGDPAAMLASSFGCAGTVPGSDQPVPFNPTGFCDPLLQPRIDAALAGRVDPWRASRAVEGEVWAEAVSLPLYQDAQVVAVRRDTEGVGPGNGFAGPFSTAGEWRGSPMDHDGW
ncbi:ABC transporter family substrate-binding protein [Salinifilum ghardaiensis]